MGGLLGGARARAAAAARAGAAAAALAAREVAGTVEEAADLPAVRALRAKAGAGVDAFGRAAVGWIDGGDLEEEEEEGGGDSDRRHPTTAPPAPPAPPPSAPTFDAAFAATGGPTAAEELDALAADAARAVNRARAAAPDADRGALDAAAAAVVAALDADKLHDGEGEEEEDGKDNPLRSGHAPVAAACEAAATAAATAADELADPATAAAATASLRDAAVAALGAASAAATARALALARSAAARSRYGRPAGDGIDWPTDDAAAIASLLASQLARAAADVDAAAACVLDTLAEADDGGDAAATAAADVEEAAGAMAGRLADAARALVPVALVAGGVGAKK